MFDILTIVLPVFLVIGAGYWAVAAGKLAPEHADGLMKFTQGFAIPCLLFLGIFNLDLAEIFKPQILASFFIGQATVFFVGYFLALTVFKRRSGEAVAVAFCGFFANSVLLGLPIVELAYGQDGLAPAFAILAVHAPFCYLIGITTMEFARAGGRSFWDTMRVVLNAIFRNPLSIGIMLGFAANLTAISLPSALETALELMRRAALPAALFGLGGILVRYKLSHRFGELAMIGMARLVVHPTIAFVLASFVFDLPEQWVKTIVIIAAMPPGINVYVFASMYDRAKGTAASAILVTTLISVVTVSVWLAILG